MRVHTARPSCTLTKGRDAVLVRHVDGRTSLEQEFDKCSVSLLRREEQCCRSIGFGRVDRDSDLQDAPRAVFVCFTCECECECAKHREYNGMHMHKYTRTHAHTHTQTRTDIHTHIQARICAHAYLVDEVRNDVLPAAAYGAMEWTVVSARLRCQKIRHLRSQNAMHAAAACVRPHTNARSDVYQATRTHAVTCIKPHERTQ
jgi:hypothetical protein